ncbi:MAG: macro domain-containing protein [Firmicutes bacterium]|nr:macro domain-containing protein [Bacillota bacterium]
MKTASGKRIAAAVLPLEDGKAGSLEGKVGSLEGKAGSLEGKAGSSGKEGGAFGSIEIRRISITDLDTDAVVNAANADLWPGGGVCGAIFRAAGHRKLEEACKRIGHCATGSAVITPGFDMKAKYIIHAVGPVWKGGKNGESDLLYGAYYRSLELAEENGCASIGFPLISAGIFSYPLKGAWTQAIKACSDYLAKHKDSRIKIIFAVLDDENIKVGREILKEFGAAR